MRNVRSISPVVATIILIVMLVAIASTAFLWISGYFQNLLTQTEEQIKAVQDVSLLQISYALINDYPKIAIYDIDKDKFALYWGWYNSTKIYKWLKECGYYVDLLTSEELDKIYRYDVFILSSGEIFPVTKPMSEYNPKINYEEIFSDYVINKGKTLIIFGAYPLFYPSYINKTTGLPVVGGWVVCPQIAEMTINGYKVYFCDRNKDGKFTYYLDFQCVTYKESGDKYICNDFVLKDFKVHSETMAYYFGLTFGDVLCHNDNCNSMKSPIAQKLFPDFPNSISPTVRPMHIWNNPNNKFFGKIKLIHLWNDTLGTKTTDNQNASHITIALYPSGGKIFHMLGYIKNDKYNFDTSLSNIDELGGKKFICRLIYVLYCWDLEKLKPKYKEEDLIYPLQLIVYNYGSYPVNLNNTVLTIEKGNTLICKVSLIFNKTFITKSGKPYILPGKQDIIKVSLSECFLKRKEKYRIYLMSKGTKTCITTMS